ncbi:MAG: AMP-binding protein [Thermomicrobiales bacterium]
MELDLYDHRLSYVHGASDAPLIGATIGDLFDRVAEQMPDNEALVSRHEGKRFSYRELQHACNEFARGLMALGIKKGDRIGIWAPNWTEWVIAQFATPKIGAILVNINPAYRVHETRIRPEPVRMLDVDYRPAVQDLAPWRPAPPPLPRAGVLPAWQTPVRTGA